MELSPLSTTIYSQYLAIAIDRFMARHRDSPIVKRFIRPIASSRIFRVLLQLVDKLPIILVAMISRSRLDKLMHKEFWQQVSRLLDSRPILAALSLSVLVLLVGLGLANWKRAHGLSYGTVEVVFGVTYGYSALFHIAPDFPTAKVLQVVSSIYIVSRGFNNISDFRIARARPSVPALA
jgi:hypothetical protein